MPEHAMEQTTATMKRPARILEPAPHAPVRAPAPAWDAAGAHLPGAPSAVLAIQRAAGNQAVIRVLDAQRPGHPLAGPLAQVQRLASELDEEDDIQRAAAALLEPSDEAIRSAAADGIRTPSTTLPYLDRIQASFGRHSIAHIQAHVGPEAARASRAMNALAYASGTHVVFGATPDLRTAAHEAAHIVQQQAGVQLSGGIGRAGDPYERHADAVADAVVAERRAEPLLERFAAPASEVQPSGTLRTENREIQSILQNRRGTAGETSSDLALVLTSAGALDEPQGNRQVIRETVLPIESRPIQRMVLVAAPRASDLDDEGEWIITTNVDYAVEQAGGPVVGFDQSDFSEMEPGEKLYIVHHGWIGNIQGYKADDIVRLLTTPPGAIPHHILGIVLLSCGAGMDTLGANNKPRANSSLVDRISAGLTKHGYDIPVAGAEGAAISSRFTSPNGTWPRVVNDEHWDAYAAIQEAVMSMYHDDIVAAMQLVMTDNPGMTTAEKADALAQITSRFYIALIQASEEAGTLFDAGEGIRIRS